MNKMKQKLEMLAIRAQLSLKKFADDESGMEVIQVLVLLAIGLGIVILFATLGDQIYDGVKDKVDAFINFLSGR